MIRNRLRIVAMVVPILAAAVAFLPAASAQAATVSSTGQFQSFGGGAGLCLDVQYAGTTPGTPLDSGRCNAPPATTRASRCGGRPASR
ncbi:MAG TPA: hypothetical protein VMU95_39735 [Trebonia sp.]|nr:hypothetical protein [Trebonia sp.]